MHKVTLFCLLMTRKTHNATFWEPKLVTCILSITSCCYEFYSKIESIFFLKTCINNFWLQSNTILKDASLKSTFKRSNISLCANADAKSCPFWVNLIGIPVRIECPFVPIFKPTDFKLDESNSLLLIRLFSTANCKWNRNFSFTLPSHLQYQFPT